MCVCKHCIQNLMADYLENWCVNLSSCNIWSASVFRCHITGKPWSQISNSRSLFSFGIYCGSHVVTGIQKYCRRYQWLYNCSQTEVRILANRLNCKKRKTNTFCINALTDLLYAKWKATVGLDYVCVCLCTRWPTAGARLLLAWSVHVYRLGLCMCVNGSDHYLIWLFSYSHKITKVTLTKLAHYTITWLTFELLSFSQIHS